MNARVLNNQNSNRIEHGYLAVTALDSFKVSNQDEPITFAKLPVPGDGYCTIHAFVMLLITRIQANEFNANDISDEILARLNHSYKEKAATVKATIQNLSNRNAERDTDTLAALIEISDQLDTTALISSNSFIESIKKIDSREKLIAAMYALSPALHHMVKPNEIIPNNSDFISTDAQVALIEQFQMNVTTTSTADGQLVTYSKGRMFLNEDGAGALTIGSRAHSDYVLIHNGTDHCDFGVNINKLGQGISTLNLCGNTELARNRQLPEKNIMTRDTQTVARQIAEAAAQAAQARTAIKHQTTSPDTDRHINKHETSTMNHKNDAFNQGNETVDPNMVENLHLVLSRNTRHASQEICNLITTVGEDALISMQEAFDDEFAKALESQNETVAFNTALKALNKPKSDFAKLLKKLGLFSAADSTSAAAATASAEMHPSVHQPILCP